jgi:hypothetical protein
MPQVKKKLGLWDEDNFSETIASSSGRGDNAGHSEHVRFLREVHKLLAKRFDFDEDKKGFAIFLLDPSFSREYPNDLFHNEYSLDEGLRKVTSRLWIVTAAIIKSQYTDVSHLDKNQCIEWIVNDLECGELPTIIYTPEADGRQIRFYPTGLNYIENVEPHQLATCKISPERIEAVVSNAHRQRMLRPGSLKGLWVDKSPSSQAEAKIQECLRDQLGGHFLGFNVFVEQSSQSGRLDILVEEPLSYPKGHNIMHAVIELKVLRSETESGRPRAASEFKGIMLEGVKQAIAYKEDRNGKIGALYCFDMRHSNCQVDCLGPILCYATHYDIALGQWTLHRTASESRHARF